MPTRSPHDAYVAKAPAFAQPILRKLQKVMRQVKPPLTETMKWSNPHWDHHGILCGMSAFKGHVNLTFWRGNVIEDPDGLFEQVGRSEMGYRRLRSVGDLPSERVLLKYVRQAMRLNEEFAARPKVTVRKAAKQAASKRTVKVPDDLARALRANSKARATFEGFTYSHKKEYVEWIEGAKRETTRANRLEQALEWMAEGKPRNWKYISSW